jgi:hypothetical protein
VETFISEFSFDVWQLQLDQESDFVARIGPGIRTRERLFEVLRHELRLPAYFGENWDALSDCLRDLSWINERRVVIQHAELPPLGEDDLSVYLDVLSECVKDWKSTDSHQLVVVFPQAARPTLSAMKEPR